MATKRKGPICELRPRGRPRKTQVIENTSTICIKAGNTVAKTELLSADASDSKEGDIANEKTMSATKVSGKIQEPICYEEGIAD